MNIWLISVIGILLIWIVIFVLRKGLRKEMVWASLITFPLAFTEPLFVPEYWNPPSLFNLATTTGFDIESFVFTFSIGGIASVLYEFFTNKEKHKKISIKQRHKEIGVFHKIALMSPIVSFLIFVFYLGINVIYLAILSMVIGIILLLLCRPDLKTKVITGGILFLVFYFFLFLVINLISPEFVKDVWTLNELLGIFVLGVPIEELLFAFCVGMLWSGYYEHVKHLK